MQNMNLKEVQTVNVAEIQCGRIPLFLISGPCVIETDDIMFKTAETLKKISEKLNLPVIFKSSFQKVIKLSRISETDAKLEETSSLIIWNSGHE